MEWRSFLQSSRQTQKAKLQHDSFDFLYDFNFLKIEIIDVKIESVAFV